MDKGRTIWPFLPLISEKKIKVAISLRTGQTQLAENNLIQEIKKKKENHFKN